MRRKYVLAGTNSPGLSDSDGLCRPHPPLRRSPFSKEKVGVLAFRLYEFALDFSYCQSVLPSSVSAFAEPASLFMA